MLMKMNFRLLAAVLFLGTVAVAQEGMRTIRVGVYEAEPLSFSGEDDAHGFNPDLLREIARERGEWRPEFVFVNWADGLEQLQAGELDLMTSVTFTDARAAVMDFCETPVLEIWSQVFVPAGSGTESVLDLHGARVAVMKKGIHGENFIRLADAFGIYYEAEEFDSHLDVFEAVASGEFDAGVVPNYFGLQHAREYGLVGSAIQFSPAPIHFAAKKGRHAEVLADIDAVLGEWKADRSSFYFQRFAYWFGSASFWERTIPVWLKLLLGVTVASTLVFLGLSWWFRREVKVRTRQLEESADRLKEAHRIARLGRWDMDFSTGRVEWSDGMYDLLELDRKGEDRVYADIMQFVHPEDRELLDEKFKTAVENHKRYELKHRVILRNGKVKWVRESGEVEYDEAGTPVMAYGTTQDITEQVEADLAVQESDERLRLATQAGQVGVWEYDFKYDNLIWDDQMFLLYGVERNAFDGKFHSWQKTVHPDDLMEAEQEFQEAVKDHKTFEAEFRVVTNRLQVKHIRGLAEIEYDNVGNPVRAIGMNWDVTSQRQMVAALTESEKDYRSLFENMTTGFTLLEVIESATGHPADYRFTQLNESACEMIGKPKLELVGQSVKDVLQPLESYWIELLENVASTETASSFEGRMAALGRTVSAWVFIPKPGYLAAVVTDTTARRKAEEEVRQAQLQLELIFDNTSDVIFKTDYEGRFTYLNSAAEELTGYAIDELLGRNIIDLVVPENRAEMGERLRRRQEGNQEPGSFYFEMEVKGGQRVILEIVTNVMSGTDGHLEAIHGIARDVTERIKAEQAVEESRRFLRGIIDTIPARVFWKDRNSVFLGGNMSFAEDAGLDDPDELVGKTDFDFVWTKEEADEFREIDREVMEQGVSKLHYEGVQTRADGSRFWLSTSKVPMRDAAGAVIGVLGAYQDITRRKELEEERVRLTTAINQSAEAIVIMDLEGFIEYVNPAFKSVTGYAEDEAIGENLALLKSNRHDEIFYSNIWKTIESGESWNGRIINKHKDGSFYTAESAISPVKAPEGNIEHYVVAIRDVSRQVELEEHVRQAQKMDAVGRLAGGVAHDFNNILQSILGFSGILLGEMDKESSQYDDVSEIRKAARRAGDLTRQLLTLSRKHNVEYTILHLNDVVRRNEKMMRRLIGEHIEFIFELDEKLSPVRADLSQIEQIILNLFINARDAMPAGGRLLVKTFNVESGSETADQAGAGSGMICLEVSDTGQGIREEVREHLFEPFFTTKQVGEGTGLGLSVVYGIVQQHGGRIEVSSQVGEGAVFNVYLPASTDGESEPDPDETVDDVRSVEGRGERVLVLEDDSMVRDLSRRMLNDAGYVVETVSLLGEAGERLGKDHYDLLMADMVLPDGSGLDFALEMRKTLSDLEVLIYSGYPHGPEVYETITRNRFRYLEKPVGSMQLLQTVREMLDEKREV